MKRIFEIPILPQGSMFKNLLKMNRLSFLVPVLILFTLAAFSQNEAGTEGRMVTGTVTDVDGEPIIGATVVVMGTEIGTITDADGKFQLDIPESAQTLQFSFIGMKSQEIAVADRLIFEIVMEQETFGLDEVVVVGYGTQKKSDITGTVASLNEDRLEMVPNLNLAQAIQGAIPGVMVMTTTAGAAPDEVIMVRGRNSIAASNAPLIVIDGIPYSGQISDVNPNDVQSIEILKDASAAAIYGSRGSNGVILITTKDGKPGKQIISYDGKYGIQRYDNVPDFLEGDEFYDFKMIRGSMWITEEETEIYEAGTWVDWYDLALRKGSSQEHNLSVSGGSERINYYVSAGLLNVKGLALNDDFLRATNRINLDIKLTDWLSVGTRTQLSFSDQSGVGPEFGDVARANPLGKPYDQNGDLTIYPWQGSEDHENPLQSILWDNIDRMYQAVTNNYALIEVPFIQGLSYRLNTGFKYGSRDQATYRGRNSTTGFQQNGSSETERRLLRNLTLENILSYDREFGVHGIFVTGVFSYEKNHSSGNYLNARGYPNDFLKWYAVSQAELIEPGHTFEETSLLSQMLRLNYAFDNRYLFTLTGRRDAFSGFGAETKWGVFPSVAAGWNLANEAFFPWKDLFSVLKIRASWGLNGNQAVGAYQAISRLGELNTIYGTNSFAGYEPYLLGQDELGWESSETVNLGLDFGLLKNRISGDINIYKTHTSDLLLERSISPVHGLTSITENIGETENKGIEFSLRSRNIVSNNFTWTTSGNMAFVKNKIIDLYGTGIDDLANEWFIGEPIRVLYGYEWLGTWQLDEAEEAATFGSQPGFVKLKDLNGDGGLSADDRMILGNEDPDLLWGMSNEFSYKNFRLNIFLHAVHGITKINALMDDLTSQNQIRRNVIQKNWWTPENPTNDWVMNDFDAQWMSGIEQEYYQKAGFVRIKDVSLSYDFSKELIQRIGLSGLRLYATGRNLYTFTKWMGGLDPELSDQRGIPLQKEIIFGLTVSF